MGGVQVGNGTTIEELLKELAQLKKDRDWYRDKCNYLEKKIKEFEKANSRPPRKGS